MLIGIRVLILRCDQIDVQYTLYRFLQGFFNGGGGEINFILLIIIDTNKNNVIITMHI